jgi:pimeloyl-ACP methyl ester carboxylesterase
MTSLGLGTETVGDVTKTGSFDFEGLRIEFEERGTGERPIVLIHGLLFARTFHYGLADALAPRGNRVILVDLLGHGSSDRPSDSRFYSVEIYARQVIALLDHLGISEAVIGGTSLGANVTLETTSRVRPRVKAMIIEMPVLEKAIPAAGVFFIPLMISLSITASRLQRASDWFKRLPRGAGLYPDIFLDLMSQDPAPTAAVLHGVLAGRFAPHPSAREKLDPPALIIGHGRDLLHPFTDAEALKRELPKAKLIRATSFLELRFAPNRLSDEIAGFLDGVWA